MPKDSSLKTVLVLGSGPIVIGQACEFDYSGVQAVRALKEEGIRVVLLNPNPATVMTEVDTADATYIEPLRPWVVRRILERENVDGVLTTLGGQTALNLAIECHERGLWSEFNVRLLGAGIDSIRLAEDREEFRKAMESTQYREGSTAPSWPVRVDARRRTCRSPDRHFARPAVVNRRGS